MKTVYERMWDHLSGPDLPKTTDPEEMRNCLLPAYFDWAHTGYYNSVIPEELWREMKTEEERRSHDQN